MSEDRADLLGRGTLAWQSDYGQFYLIDTSDGSFRPPADITDEVLESGFHVPLTGLVIYTNDCLQQHVRIAIWDRRPVLPDTDPMTGAPWTRVAMAELRFPTFGFGLSSPSSPSPLPCGPIFLVPNTAMAARIAWKEFAGDRDDSVPIDPDVIGITLWPQA